MLFNWPILSIFIYSLDFFFIVKHFILKQFELYLLFESCHINKVYDFGLSLLSFAMMEFVENIAVGTNQDRCPY